MAAKRSRGATRIERDTLGVMKVPADALYGAQTARAIANFPVSGWRMPDRLLSALAEIKAAFAVANREAGLLDRRRARAIEGAAREVAAGRHAEQFPIDVFQTGSGTSTNMNVNEVIAHLANVRVKGDPSAHRPVHPNDHVNLGQSSNDAIPAALRIAAVLGFREELEPALATVNAELRRLAAAHRRTLALGRTHLMDAVPTTYGRVFGAWAERLNRAAKRARAAADGLLDLPLGGTAVGSGIGGNRKVARSAQRALAARWRLRVRLASNTATGIAAQDDLIGFADTLAGVGRVLFAIANDIRLRASGPFGGIGELELPAVQPGSSIMPGKVNPVIAESVVQVAIEVEGLAAACRASVALHQLDLSHANPLLAWNIDTMTRLLAAACRMFASRCLRGLRVDVARARKLAESSPALATALARGIGYEKAAQVAKTAEAAYETVMAAALRLRVLPADELASLLDLETLAGVKVPRR